MTPDSSAASFDVHLVFAGLILLVPEPGASPRRVHGLLPATERRVGQWEMEPHAPRLLVGKRYRTSGDGTYRLDGRSLDLSGVAATPPPVFEPGDILEIPGSVETGLLEGETDSGALRARVSVESGRFGKRSRGGPWSMGGRPSRPRPTWADWVIPGMPGTSLEIELRDLKTGATAERIRATPRGGRVELFVFHTPHPDMIPDDLEVDRFPAPRPPMDVRARHFAALYPLVGRDAPTDAEIPTWDGGKIPEGGGHGHEKGIDYACLLATAPAR